MSQKVIRITSQQGFSAVYDNTTKPVGLNLLDFTIPRGYNINMAESYCAINGQINNSSGNPANASFFLEVNNNDKINVPTSALIRNCSITNDKGQIESIRRLDTLNCALYGLEDEAEEKKGNMNSFAQFEADRGVKNQTSFNLDVVTDNTTPDGATVNTSHISREISRDIKIPLNQMFGMCNSEAYSTDIWGETRIHIETNFASGTLPGLQSRHLGGSEDTSLMFDQTNNYGDMVSQNGIAAEASTGPLESLGGYGDWENNYPFYVGQQVLVKKNVSTIGDVTTTHEITAIKFQGDNTANPPTNKAKVFMTLNPPAFTNPVGDPARDITAIEVKADVNPTLSNVINRAELVLTLTEESPDEEIEFSTYTSEEDNGNDLTSFSRTYLCEPEANALFVACCNTGGILPARTIESYRYAVDNEEQTGNRDVVIGQPLHFDRLQRCLDSQVGLGFKNAQLQFYKNTNPQASAYFAPISMICETLEETEANKKVAIQIECAAQLKTIILYKSMSKSISK